MRIKGKSLAYICIVLLIGTIGMTYASTDKTEEQATVRFNLMIDSLNKDLAEEWASYIQYKKHDWEGKSEIQNQDIINQNLFRNLANDELDHIDKLGQRISDLGGVPTKKPSVIVEGGDIKKMVQDDLAKENAIALQIKEHIVIATDLGDTETKKMLEKILSDEEKQITKLEDVLGIK